jgi:tetratricopeptide (TPR) repeat protein
MDSNNKKAKPQPNDLLHRERDLKNWTLQDVANKLFDMCVAEGRESGISADTVGRWERGVSKPQAHYRAKLCKLFGKTAAELGLIEGIDTGAFVENHQEDDIEMNRREATKTIGKIIGASVVAATQPLEQLATLLKPARVDADTLEHFNNLTEICWKLGNGHELETAGAILESYLPKVAAVAQQSSPYQEVAAAIASQGYLLSASLAGHRDDLDARESYSIQSLQFGQIAQDYNLQVAALKQLAVTYDYKQRPGKALATYQRAIPYLDHVSPLLRSGICIRMSGAYAQCGQEQEALRYLGIAHESFPAIPEQDPGYLYADSGLYSLLLWDGLIHLDLDQPKEAERAFARVDGLAPKIEVPERVRIEFLTYQATTYMALRELEQSCTYLEESVKASLALGSERRYSEAYETYQQMRQVWPQERKVKTLKSLFAR